MFANVATLTGLMGTIYGLILAFDAVGGTDIPEDKKTQFLAKGISAAMNTTIFGLMVVGSLFLVPPDWQRSGPGDEELPGDSTSNQSAEQNEAQ